MGGVASRAFYINIMKVCCVVSSQFFLVAVVVSWALHKQLDRYIKRQDFHDEKENQTEQKEKKKKKCQSTKSTDCCKASQCVGQS